MIRPPGFQGAAFGTAVDGDGRLEPAARRRMAGELRIPTEWAYLHQVHGSRVWPVAAPGLQGDGDALFTTVLRLPLAVGTADCLPVVLEGPGGVGLAHMGWRGAVAGVVAALRAAMEAAGAAPVRAALGPGIGPCCYEVGPEVLERLHAYRTRTRRGSDGVDLAAAAAAGLTGLEVWRASACTCCSAGFHSYRGDGSRERQVAVAWRT
ncbi:MAG: polyphenol oxidase family protein [Actinomycetota bacterium]